MSGRRLLVVSAWATVAVLVAVAGLRLFVWDGRVLVVGLDAVLPIVLLPAWVVLVVAVVVRRYLLLGAAVAVIAVQVAVVAPELTARQPVPVGLRHAAQMRLFDANVQA